MFSKSYLVAIAFIFIQQTTFGNQHRHSTKYGCSKCPPGYHVDKPCLHKNDTICIPCEANTYLPHNSYKQKCYLCSKCGRDLYVAHECTPIRDTICDTCNTYRGPKNADYQQHCAKNTSLEESELPRKPSIPRKTIPSNRQIGRLQQLEESQEEEEQPSNTYLAMMLVGVGACALACLLTGIVVYSCYGTKKWKEGSNYLYKNVYLEESSTKS